MFVVMTHHSSVRIIVLILTMVISFLIKILARDIILSPLCKNETFVQKLEDEDYSLHSMYNIAKNTYISLRNGDQILMVSITTAVRFANIQSKVITALLLDRSYNICEMIPFI